MTRAAWTWMVYLATHNDVASAGEASLERMRRVPLDGRVTIVVQQATPRGTVRRVLGAVPEVVADLGGVDSGDPQAVLDFVRWAAANAPADRYACVFWSHGTGWQVDDMVELGRRESVPVPVTRDELVQRGAGDEGRQVFFSTTMRRLLSRPTPAERAVAFDDGSGHSLDTVELGEVARRAAQLLGRPLDLLGMNACQMGNVEVAYQLRKHVGVYVASAEDMPVQGWPYDDILGRLAAAPDTDPDALGRLIVERYCAYFRDAPLRWNTGGLPPGVTLVAVRPGQIGRLRTAVQSLAAVLRDDITAHINTIWQAHRHAYRFKFHLRDLAGFCRPLAEQGSASRAAADAARATLDALSDPGFVLARQHTGAVYDGTGGLTTYLMEPRPRNTISPHYAETDYARDTAWGEFLAAYHRAARGPARTNGGRGTRPAGGEGRQ